MNSELYKKLEATMKGVKCKNKGCLSAGNDNLELVWFGEQYEQKLITCSSCFIMNDEAVKKSSPTLMNVLPVSAFLKKFVEQAKAYEEIRNSNNWQPIKLKSVEKEHESEMQNFDCKLNATLRSLSTALQGFTKKVIVSNDGIYSNTTFNEIIGMYSSNEMGETLAKMNLLIKFLNYGEDGAYRFDDLQVRERKLKKLSEKINQVTLKVLKALDDLLKDIQERNANITKI